MTEWLRDLPPYIPQQGDEWQGADHTDGPRRPIPAPQSGLPWRTDRPAAPASLSPAAQAVLDSMHRSYDHEPTRRLVAAAVLRATADQVFPEERRPYDAFLKWLGRHPADPAPWQVRASKRAELLAIAAELEGING